MSRDRTNMARCRAQERTPALRRQQHIEDTPVGEAGATGHEALVNKTIDRSGEAALRQERTRGEVGRSSAGLRPARQLHEKAVLSEGQTQARVSLTFERVGRCGMGVQECFPGGYFRLA